MASGNFISSTGTNLNLYVTWSSTPNTNANTSSVTANVYMRSYTISATALADSYITINGNKKSFAGTSLNKTSNSLTDTLLTTHTVTVDHNTDGKKSITIKANLEFNGTVSGKYLSDVTASKTVDLDNIPRASGLTVATSINTGAVLTSTISPANSTFTHLIEYYIDGEYKGHDGTLAAGTNTCSRTIEHSWLPNKNSATLTVKLLTYGVTVDSDVMAKDISFASNGAEFTCLVAGKEYKVSLSMNGMFSVYNVLAAITTALAVGFDIEKSIKVLEKIPGVAGRFEIVTTKPTVIVDYAHTPDGLENVLKAAREITPENGKLICIFGCGGDRDTTKRPKMGSIAETLADKVIITSDNPRSENPQQIITDILAGFKSTTDVIVESDRELAIKEAYKIANVNDVVLVAGKGHEDYQILANETIHFDDREKVREIFG